jgi:hypothetical protein
MLKLIKDELTSNINFTIDIMKDIKNGAKDEFINFFKEAKSIFTL